MTTTPADHSYELRVIREDSQQEEFPLTATLLIGRFVPGSGIKPNVMLIDPRVSREHFRIGCAAEGPWLECTGKNGIELNGRTVTGRHALHEGDRLQLFEAGFQILRKSAAPENTSDPKTGGPRKRRIVLAAAAAVIAVAGAFLAKSGKGSFSQSGATNRGTKEQVSQAGPARSAFNAADEAKLARKLLDERNIMIENRFSALQHYGRALAAAGKDTSGPAAVWRAESTLVSGELDSLFEEARKKSVVAFRQGKYDLAQEYLEHLMRLYPDPAHSRYRWAKENWLVVSKKNL